MVTALATYHRRVAGPTSDSDHDVAPTERLAGRYRWLADREFHGYCPTYERLALAIAADAEVLGRLATLVGPLDERHVPVLAFAATHDVALAEPDGALATSYTEAGTDPWPAWRELLLTRFDELAATMARRSIQTNEVGRAAAIVPALGLAAERAGTRRLALIELGPSAGLNLLFDRFHIVYDDGRSSGPTDSPVQLTCRLVGPRRPPLPEHLDVVERSGIDLAPLDVTDPDDARWLAACLWPRLHERATRLDAAIGLARREPPRLRRGDAVTLLPEVLAELAARTPDDTLLAVVATWVLAYLGDAERRELTQPLADLGARRPVVFVTAEYPGIAPWIPVPERVEGQPPGGATLLGAATWAPDGDRRDALAWMHAHGDWLAWVH